MRSAPRTALSVGEREPLSLLPNPTDPVPRTDPQASPSPPAAGAKTGSKDTRCQTQGEVPQKQTAGHGQALEAAELF